MKYLISKIYIFFRNVERHPIGVFVNYLLIAIGLITPILVVLGVFNAGDFLSRNPVEIQIYGNNNTEQLSAIQNQLEAIANNTARERIVLIALVLLLLFIFVWFSQKKFRGSGYREASNEIHLFNHNLRDAHLLLSGILNGTYSFEERSEHVKASIVKALNNAAKTFKIITGAECSITIKRLELVKGDGDTLQGKVKTWLRDEKTQSDRRAIDSTINTHNLDNIEGNEHFRKVAIPDDNYYIYIEDIKRNNSFTKLDSFTAWQLNGRKPPYRSILMVGISAFEDPVKKFDENYFEPYDNIGILYVDCHKPYAFGYHCQEVLHSFSDALFPVMKYFSDAYNQSQESDEHAK